MFTGIVQGVGSVAALERRGGDLALTFDTGTVAFDSVEVGGSIAVNGVCLTATEVAPHGFAADVSRETLALTTVTDWCVGTRVNLEKALRAGDALGGHYVSGHVDGVGEVTWRRDEARSVRVGFSIPRGLARYIASKGSICVDGVSLTVNAVDAECFEVNLVPHTLQSTILGAYGPRSRVNLEIDIIARYVERLYTQQDSIPPDTPG